ncbi:GntR family transcriptional regulator [Caproiciproducens galactitolivorans]|uniref:HTH-type transcriptional repressor DasR n=1 Tax=Caproiciproducens galactitolivorans TaxID=642589 RepID=A0A4Z0XXE0_9FIRM|nr:GntR family transcriptional regulator [Caproiciproducens galactitolivorans]QEY33676.1 GntR family transcriptional regulator [Caproiciproducens galactitolivorans]TGJ76199.1 HTH-type transcriptional repressor DasR [Caproiciproducens galactitolivorans]
MDQIMLPKYYILKQKLIEKIDQEEFKANEMIPSERELIQQYDVSRITVRKAIDELVNEGYLYKVQGKGTFVKSDAYSQDLISITSCTQDVINLGMTPSRKVISASVLEADNKRCRNLELGKNEKVFRLERVYYADSEPINHTVTYLPYKLFPGIEKYDFSKESLYKVLEEKYDIKITKAKRSVEAILAKDKIAEYLDVEPGKPILLFGCITYGISNGKEIPIENFKCCYRSDKFKFYINQVK